MNTLTVGVGKSTVFFAYARHRGLQDRPIRVIGEHEHGSRWKCAFDEVTALCNSRYCTPSTECSNCDLVWFIYAVHSRWAIDFEMDWMVALLRLRNNGNMGRSRNCAFNKLDCRKLLDLISLADPFIFSCFLKLHSLKFILFRYLSNRYFTRKPFVIITRFVAFDS